jgi:hypothetical protein
VKCKESGQGKFTHDDFEKENVKIQVRFSGNIA